jgi:hypothetical protein
MKTSSVATTGCRLRRGRCGGPSGVVQAVGRRVRGDGGVGAGDFLAWAARRGHSCQFDFPRRAPQTGTAIADAGRWDLVARMLRDNSIEPPHHHAAVGRDRAGARPDERGGQAALPGLPGRKAQIPPAEGAAHLLEARTGGQVSEVEDGEVVRFEY